MFSYNLRCYLSLFSLLCLLIIFLLCICSWGKFLIFCSNLLVHFDTICHYICFYVSIRVIKMYMICTFYIDYHIYIDPNASILFVMMNARNFSFSQGLPLGCMLIENGFGHHNNRDWNFLIAKHAVIKKIMSLNMWWLKLFSHQSWGNQIFLVTIYATIESFWSWICVG
jgi:hypothetical protein